MPIRPSISRLLARVNLWLGRLEDLFFAGRRLRYRFRLHLGLHLNRQRLRLRQLLGGDVHTVSDDREGKTDRHGKRRHE